MMGALGGRHWHTCAGGCAHSAEANGALGVGGEGIVR